MKRSVKFIFASLCALAMYSCAREVAVPNEEYNAETYSYTFDLSQDQESKALLEDGGVIAWEEGDNIAVYIYNGSNYELVKGTVSVDGMSQAVVNFNCSTELSESTPVYSYYPYHEGETRSTISLAVADEQDGTMSFMPMVGKLDSYTSESGQLKGQFLMMNLAGAFQFKVYSSNHSDEKIEKISMNVAGSAHLNDEAGYAFDTNETIWAETGSNSVAVSTRRWIEIPSDAASATPVQMIVAPGSIVNPEITIYTDKATYTKTLTSTYEITRNYLKAFKANIDSWSRNERPQATITWSINNVESQTLQAVGTKLIFPEVSETAGYEFMGWGSEEISGTQQDAPEMINADSDVLAVDGKTYFAVYAVKHGSGTEPEVQATLTFTDTEWGFPAGSGNKTVDRTTYTHSTSGYSVTVEGSEGEGFYIAQSTANPPARYALLMGKVGASLTLPQFSFPVSKLIVYGATGGQASAKVTWDLYSGNDVASTATEGFTGLTTGAQVEVPVADAFKNEQLAIKVTNANNYQVSKIEFYNCGSYFSDYCTFIDNRIATSLSWGTSEASARIGDSNTFPVLTKNPSDLEGVSFVSSNTDCATIDPSTGAIELVAAGTTTITASFGGNSTYKPAVDASYELTVSEAVQKHTLHFSINEVLDAGILVAEGDLINFPEDPSIDGVLFLGWVKEALDAPQQTAPTCVVKAKETMGTEDVTYYAVFYKRSGSEPSEELAQTLQYDTWTYSGSTTDKSSYRLFHSGSYIESAAFDRSKLSKVIVYGGTFGGDSYNKLTIGDGTNTWKSVTVSGSSQTGVNTYTNGTALSGTGKLRITSNSGSASSNGLRISKVEIYVQTGGYVYSDYCTTVISLGSIAISGSVTKTTYDAGDVLDPTGLTVTATYSDNSHEDVTSSVEWSFSPATLPAGNNQSCTATATYGGKFASKEVTGLTVRETSKEDPTITATNKADLAVNTTFDVSTMFNSNSTGAFTYAITANPESKGSLAADGKTFKATAAGTYTIQASQAATPTYNAGVKTATITVVAGGEKNVVIDKTTTGSTSNSYVTTDTEFTTDGVTYKVKNWNPSTLQVRGNQSTAGNNFHIYNTTAMPSGIKTIVVTVDGSITTNKIFVATGTSAQTTHITSGTQGTYDSTAKTLTFTLNTLNKYFTLCLVNGSTSGTVKFTNIQITY